MLFRFINIGGYARCILSYKEIEDELNSLYLYLHLFYNNPISRCPTRQSAIFSDFFFGFFLRIFNVALRRENQFRQNFTTISFLRRKIGLAAVFTFFFCCITRDGIPRQLAPTFIKIDFIDFKKLFETDSDIVRGDTSRDTSFDFIPLGDVPPALKFTLRRYSFLNGIKFMPAVKGEKCPLLYRNEFSRQSSSDTLHIKI